MQRVVRYLSQRIATAAITSLFARSFNLVLRSKRPREYLLTVVVLVVLRLLAETHSVYYCNLTGNPVLVESFLTENTIRSSRTKHTQNRAKIVHKLSGL